MDNAFTHALRPSPDLTAARAHRGRLFAQLDTPPFVSPTRDMLVRDIWAESAVMACHLAHDQGLADIAAAIPRAGARLTNWDRFFMSIARLAQTAAEPPIAHDTLRRYGLLPSTCSSTIADFHQQALHVLASLDHGHAATARHHMQTLLAPCTFRPDTDRDTAADTP